jgi:tRNA threonylcarbamoyladenosine biosynthesis protein TsaE
MAADATRALERRLVSRSGAATAALGEALGARLAAGAVVAIDGELGAGKTTLVRGLARGLGVERGVASPSYTLMHTYTGRLPVFHYDAWMQERERAFFEGGGAEWLEAGGVALVEWAERVADWLPEPRLHVLLLHPPAPRTGSDPGWRRIHLTALGGPPEGALRDLVLHLPLPEGVTEEP